MRYHLVAVDFLPPPAIRAALTRLACEFARGAFFTPYDCLDACLLLPAPLT